MGDGVRAHVSRRMIARRAAMRNAWPKGKAWERPRRGAGADGHRSDATGRWRKGVVGGLQVR